MVLRYGRAALAFALSVLAVVATAAAVSAGPIRAGTPQRPPHTRSLGYDITVTGRHGGPVRLHALEMGHGPTILLLHGLGGSTYTWRKVMPALSVGHRVIAVDLKGFGRSEKVFDAAYTTADQAALVMDFMRRRGLSGVTLAGHSYGGAVALAVTLAAQRGHPDLVRRLALIDAPAYPQRLAPFLAFLQRPVLPYALLALVPPELAASAALDRQVAAGAIDENDVRAYAAPFHDAAARHALIASARQLMPRNIHEIVARYPSIRQPTLLVWCSHDDVVPPSTGRRLQRTLPDARLAIIPGCEHSPADEKPAELVRLMRGLLAR